MTNYFAAAADADFERERLLAMVGAWGRRASEPS